MVESDHSDMESQDEMPPLEISNTSVDDNVTGQKRLREDTSEDEKVELPAKKLCTSADEVPVEKQNSENSSEVNGIVENVKEDTENISVDTKEDKTKLELDQGTKEEEKESDVAISETKDDNKSVNKDNAVKNENEFSSLVDTKEEKDSISMESEENDNVEDTMVKKEAEEETEDDIKPRKKRKKSQIEDAEVVEGLELSVECASDKESSSSSEGEDKKEKKPVPKTIIVKEKANDSELDVSSSEAQMSDSQDVSDDKGKQLKKKGRKRGRTSFSKPVKTDSEENNDDVSDEDYSPKTKRKLKKTAANKKVTKPPTESKRGRGRAKKNAKTVIEKEEEEDENSNITEDKKTEDKEGDEQVSDTKSLDDNSEDDIDSEDASKSGRRRRSTKPDDDKRIQMLKKYIRLAGIHVKSYNDLWANCKSNAARIRCLKDLLTKNGITGRPTVEKCKKAKERNERLKDVAELNTSNIISEGRVTRAQRNKDSNKESKTPETPPRHREARSSFKRVLNVIDSDSE